MIIRIVKMTFQKEMVDKFQLLFDSKKELIRNFKGVAKLELYRDRNQPNVFFTYSEWEDIHHLEQYRRSELFKNVWSETRNMFAEKAEAWSVDKLISI